MRSCRWRRRRGRLKKSQTTNQWDLLARRGRSSVCLLRTPYLLILSLCSVSSLVSVLLPLFFLLGYESDIGLLFSHILLVSSNHKSERNLNHTTGLRIYRLQKEMGSHLMSSFLVYFVMDILYFVSFTTLHLISRSMSLFLAHIFEFTPNVWFRVLICTWERGFSTWQAIYCVKWKFGFFFTGDFRFQNLVCIGTLPKVGPSTSHSIPSHS